MRQPKINTVFLLLSGSFFFRPTFLLTFTCGGKMSAGLSPLLPRRPSPLSLRFFFLSSVGASVGVCWFWRAAAAQPVTQQTLWHMSRIWKETRLLCGRHSALRHVAALRFFAFRPRRIQQWALGASADELNKRQILHKRWPKISFACYKRVIFGSDIKL